MSITNFHLCVPHNNCDFQLKHFPCPMLFYINHLVLLKVWFSRKFIHKEQNPVCFCSILGFNPRLTLNKARGRGWGCKPPTEFFSRSLHGNAKKRDLETPVFLYTLCGHFDKNKTKQNKTKQNKTKQNKTNKQTNKQG